jgi:hypothetical protein
LKGGKKLGRMIEMGEEGKGGENEQEKILVRLIVQKLQMFCIIKHYPY